MKNIEMKNIVEDVIKETKTVSLPSRLTYRDIAAHIAKMSEEEQNALAVVVDQCGCVTELIGFSTMNGYRPAMPTVIDTMICVKSLTY